ncbi:very short patch repair endonuclease [Streptomyces sp. NRRL S-455]|uniref:very short patch repair endonuclease n=1 Tax=Streptomyces sp. NRRL S-455 TaxID=1463908 RepID=UPI0018FE71CB|nr:very short patch repair endonuclease [Streptomyces sp. NRRL S-455]
MVTSPRPSWASSDAARSTMRANRSRDSHPEMALRRAVHALGLRYRVCKRPLPSLRRTADLVFSRARVAVFLDGCFWHGCPKHHSTPLTHSAYWSNKIRGNQDRDRDTDAQLAAAGWLTIRVWEHEDPVQAAQLIAQSVRARSNGPH